MYTNIYLKLHTFFWTHRKAFFSIDNILTIILNIPMHPALYTLAAILHCIIKLICTYFPAGEN